MNLSDLSLHILDIVQNSIKANATLIKISVDINIGADSLVITVKDNGCGMDEKTLRKVLGADIAHTGKGGFGIPLFRESAIAAGGTCEITSKEKEGTAARAEYPLNNPKRKPLGNVADTVETLIFCNPDIDFVYTYSVGGKGFTLNTAEMKKILGGIPLNDPDVMRFIRDFLRENTAEIKKENIFRNLENF